MLKQTLLHLLLLASLSAQAQGPVTSLTGPMITFETMEFDYGSIEQGSDGRCTFTFTNTGNEPLIITRSSTSCGCMVSKHDPEPIMPGRGSAIEVRYDSNRIGPFQKSITVSSNAVNMPTVVLRVKGVVLQTGSTMRGITPAVEVH